MFTDPADMTRQRQVDATEVNHEGRGRSTRQALERNVQSWIGQIFPSDDQGCRAELAIGCVPTICRQRANTHLQPGNDVGE